MARDKNNLAAYKRIYRAANAEKIAAYQKLYREANKTKKAEDAIK